MRMDVVRRASRSVLLLLVCVAMTWSQVSIVWSGDAPSSVTEFSGTLIIRVNGKTHHAQVYGQADRLRLEYRYAVRTELGLSAIEIIRFDLAERWYILPQQKLLLVLPVTDDTPSIRPKFDGETNRIAAGDAMVAGRAARLFNVEVKRNGIPERFHEWVDAEMGLVLKVVSQDRDWSFEYERLRFLPQPRVYFEPPPGYHKRLGGTIQRHGN